MRHALALVVAMLVAGCGSTPAPPLQAEHPEATPAPWPALPCEADPVDGLSSSLERLHLETFEGDSGDREELDSITRGNRIYLAVARPSGDAIDILDVTDPQRPGIVSTWAGQGGGYADDIKFTPDGTAIVSGGRDRLSLINVEDLAQPFLEHDHELAGVGAHMVATWDLGNESYVSISKAEGGDLSIFRIDGARGDRTFTRMSHLAATPLGEPGIVQRPDPVRSHDTWFEIDPHTGRPLLWVANVYWGIVAYDMGHPEAPVLAATIPNAPPYAGYMHNVQVAHIDGRRLVVGVQEYGTGVLKVWDATDLAAPRYAAYFAPGLATTAFHNLQVVGQYALAGHFDEGLYVMNLATVGNGITATQMEAFAHAPAAGSREGRVPVGLVQGNFGTQDVEVRNGVVWTSEAGIGVQTLAFGCFMFGEPAHTSSG